MDKPSLRIGDTERDAAVELLQSHYAAGRLTTEEFGERMTSALAAHYQADLDLLFTDLPSDPQARFFDEAGPVGRAARPSELTPWQAPAPVAARSAGRRAAAAAFSAVSGLIWPAAIIAVLSGAPVQVLFLALVVSVAAGAARKS
uniref:DUF1707 SHOCT-like domain-containing protein n=1 Tax=uncultured Propionibacterium sp. TaxID=218066 RepID=UPI002930D383